MTACWSSGRRSESLGASWSSSSTLHPSSRFSHAPVPQTVDSVGEVLKILDKLVPDVEQVIEVPKILQHTVPQRSSLQEPQMAEQLVEVPGFEFVFVRLCLGVVSAAGYTWAMRVHDTGWSDTACPGRHTNTGHS